MDMNVSGTERELLIRLLQGALGDVRSQVRRTHNPEWHDGLKGEEVVMKGLIEKLSRN